MSGAALSDYGQRILEERRRLLGALVQHLTGEQVGVAAALPAWNRSPANNLLSEAGLKAPLTPLLASQPETEQHYELVEASMAATQYHQFVDVAPRVVDELVDRQAQLVVLEYLAACVRVWSLKKFVHQAMCGPVCHAGAPLAAAPAFPTFPHRPQSAPCPTPQAGRAARRARPVWQAARAAAAARPPAGDTGEVVAGWSIARPLRFSQLSHHWAAAVAVRLVPLRRGALQMVCLYR